MARRSNPSNPPPLYRSWETRTGVTISIAASPDGTTTTHGTMPRVRPRQTCCTCLRMTTGNTYIEPSSTSTHQEAMRLVSTTPPGSSRTLERSRTSSPHHSPRTSASPPVSRIPLLTSQATPGIIWIPPTVSSPSTPRSPHLGMRTNSRPQRLSNPYNRTATSTTVPLLQVVTLIDNNGFAQSFATAYIHTRSILRMVNGTIQAVPDFRQE